MYSLRFTDNAKKDLESLESKNLQTPLKAVRKALGYLQLDPRHTSLNTHKYNAMTGVNGEEIFEAYAQNKTPGAYRIFWYYSANKTITVIAITPHP